MYPDNCFSEQPWGRDGVTFESTRLPRDQVSYRVADTGDELEIRIGRRRIVFRAKDCSVLEGDLLDVGVSLNHVQALHGKFRVSCSNAAGERIVGAISFFMCGYEREARIPAGG
jgi:hypothetical protein